LTRIPTCTQCDDGKPVQITLGNGSETIEVCSSCASRILKTSSGYEVYGTRPCYDEALLAQLSGAEKTKIVEAVLRGVA
jgi:hypothetical protein